MKKYIIIVMLGLFLATGGAIAYKREVGDWSEWWHLGNNGGRVKRIYDKENKLVCWVYSNGNKGGIDCEPSLELDHPSLIK